MLLLLPPLQFHSLGAPGPCGSPGRFLPPCISSTSIIISGTPTSARGPPQRVSPREGYGGCPHACILQLLAQAQGAAAAHPARLKPGQPPHLCVYVLFVYCVREHVLCLCVCV